MFLLFSLSGEVAINRRKTETGGPIAVLSLMALLAETAAVAEFNSTKFFVAEVVTAQGNFTTYGTLLYPYACFFSSNFVPQGRQKKIEIKSSMVSPYSPKSVQ